MNILLTVLAIMMLGASLCAQPDQTITITSGGIQRTFDVHLPSTPPAANLPVVLCFHGTGGTSAGMMAVTGLSAIADKNNFIVVYPQAVTIGADVQWNVYVDDKPGHAGVGDPNAPDDIMFTRDMIDYLATNYNIDRAHVYATGLSNGGFMCYALSMLAANEIKAIAPVAASLWADDVYLNQLIASGTVMPMPVMHVHGTADNVVDYPDPDNTPKDYEEYPLFVSSRVCGALTYNQVMPVMAGVDKLVFCGPPVEVFLIRIQGMGHAWTNGTYPTSNEIVKFFGLEKTSGVSEQQVREVLIAPNPANETLHIELPEAATVQAYSALGGLVFAAEHPAGSVDVPCGDVPAGPCLLRIVSGREKKATTMLVMIVH